MTTRRAGRRFAVLTALAVTATACSGGSEGDSDPMAIAVEQVPSTGAEEVPSALENPTASGLPEPLVDVNDIRSGGPPPDGIPAIDEPRFLAAGDVAFLEDEESVLVLELGGEARAYPVQVMTWHEIVNDTIDGRPVTVSYCPLCNSAIAFDRRVGNRVLDFGTSGSLFRSALVMYDRQTESLWTHFDGRAVAGALTGTELDLYPMATVSWRDFRDAHPDGLVLSRDTGYTRDYGSNPYPGYDDENSDPFLFEGNPDPRLSAKERVVGVRRGDDAVAIPLETVADAGVLDVELGRRDLVVWHQAGTASALDAPTVPGGRDIGATGVFRPEIDGQRLHFEPRRNGGFRDRETGSSWDVLGRATDGPLEGRQLQAVEHVDTFWFAWAAYRPDTGVLHQV